VLRSSLLRRARQLAALARAGLKQTEPGTARILLASDQAHYTSEQQFAPLKAYNSALRAQLGVVLDEVLLGAALAMPAAFMRRYDAILFKLSFRTPEREALRITRRLRERAGDRVKLIYFDGDDDLCIQWPSVLAEVDRYVKGQMFADPGEYQKSRIGKTNLTDYVAKTFGTSFADDNVPKGQPVPVALMEKVSLGWNLSQGDRIRGLLERQSSGALGYAKDIDVVCRVGLPPGAWTNPLRMGTAPHLQALEEEYRVSPPGSQVSQEQYDDELRRSRICVSPFGYGEICWRDFEAVLCGSLLVKPNVDHLRTEPDIFIANETYVPVKWDFSDLEKTLRTYLEEPREADRIRKNALDRLDRYHHGGEFLRTFGGLLEAAGVPVGAGGRIVP
jgi:hypothetical protein